MPHFIAVEVKKYSFLQIVVFFQVETPYLIAMIDILACSFVFCTDHMVEDYGDKTFYSSHGLGKVSFPRGTTLCSQYKDFGCLPFINIFLPFHGKMQFSLHFIDYTYCREWTAYLSILIM